MGSCSGQNRRRYRGTGGRRRVSGWGCGSNCGKDGNGDFSGRKSVCGGVGVIGHQKRAWRDLGQYTGKALAGSLCGVLALGFYNSTSGVSLKATPGKTTTTLGTYPDDTGNILNELGNIKSMDFGPRAGGFNLRNTLGRIYNKLGPDGFWNQCNKPWLDNAIARNDIILLATEPTENTSYRMNKVTGVKELGRFGREHQYLIDHGYVFGSVRKQMIKK